MMTISGVSGANNMQEGTNMQTDPVSRNLQNQIAEKQKRLQELSSNEEMAPEEKMKKRQEIQQEITSLNQQLRQHQIEQRREQQQQSKDSSAKEQSGSIGRSGKKETGISQTSMQAMISADSSIKEAQVQGSVAAQMEGRTRVLKAEMKQDSARGASTEKKEEELAELQHKIQKTTTSQMSKLADANKTIKEAAEKEQETESAEAKDKKDSINKTVSTGNDTEEPSPGDKAEKYTSVDVRL